VTYIIAYTTHIFPKLCNNKLRCTIYTRIYENIIVYMTIQKQLVDMIQINS